MKTIASYLDMRSSKETNEQIIRLDDYISGRLNEKTRNFFQAVSVRHATGLEKIIHKCALHKIYLQSEHIDLIVDSLYLQHTLPVDILNSIQYFLLDKRADRFINYLNTAAQELDKSMAPFDAFKATTHVITSLDVYHTTGRAKQFLSTVLTLMLNFYAKNRTAKHLQHRNYEDTAKWMKSLLALSAKSDLSKLIDLLALRIQFIYTNIFGETRNMSLLELYCLFDDLSTQAEQFEPDDSNKSLLLDIDAMALMTLVSIKAPTAFFDVIYAQQNHAEQNILELLKTHLKRPLIIDEFFNSTTFKSYYCECSISTHSNQQTFLAALVHWFQRMGHTAYPKYQDSLTYFSNFIESSKKHRINMTNEAFSLWLEHQIKAQSLITHVKNALFFALEHEAHTNITRNGSLIFVANRLVSMGISPKAVSATQSGRFQPLIQSNVLHIDLQNLALFHTFFEKLPSEQQQQCLTELCFINLFTAQNQNEEIEQVKVVHKKIVHQNYLMPATLHHIQKARQARPTRIARQEPNYSVNTFESTNPKIKLTKTTAKYATRH